MKASWRLALVGLAMPLRIYLGVVFIAAAWYKIADPGVFALSIATYGILPDSLINLMAIMLPWIEVLVGASLIIGLWTRASALVVGGMMIMFIVSLAIALAKDLHMSCGCFAAAEAGDEINMGTLIRDILWLLGAAYLVAVDDGRWGIDGLWRRLRNRKAEP
jgi:uncharacterized membrane protein YphA (DoxX/SURF4 family)